MQTENNEVAHLVIPGQPTSKKNHPIVRCINGKPIVVHSKAYRQFEKQALKTLLFYKGTKFNGPIHVTAYYWLKDRRRPDLNNLMAATADVLEKAGIIRNDRDIVSWDGSCIMGISNNPRTEILIRKR